LSISLPRLRPFSRSVQVAKAALGKGKVFLYGPEIAFRGQPHGTFKLLFNGIYYGPAKTVDLVR
jgi:hypothetical protein